MIQEWITSVGIDIGTSTTKMIISRLRLGRKSSTFALPRYEIVEKKLVYSSAIYATPLINFDEIDMEHIAAWLQQEYQKANIQLEDIKSGAVIITGETANKRNAKQILHVLAERSGDFVVATAGADLEALLAGKGSGALERSKQIKGVIANIDIGGGTANTALFHRGKLIGTVTFHIGGRLLRLSKQGTLLFISSSLFPWLRANKYHLQVNQTMSFTLLQQVTLHLVQSMLTYLKGNSHVPHIKHLIISDTLTSMPMIDEIMISGGIGQLMWEQAPTNMAEVAVYDDFGPLLAYIVREECQHTPFQLIKPIQTVRATVIGAGMQSTEISGSTVHVDASLLPIRNLPVLKVELLEQWIPQKDYLQSKFHEVMQEGLRLFDADHSPPFALSLIGLSYCSYASLQSIADFLSHEFKRTFPNSSKLVVICENDMAKALGQSLDIRCKGFPHVLCIDQVSVEHGDYLDLGEPIAETIIPVIVKTLAFDR